ncbi:type VI secretion system-associated protein TagF [Acetobacteraceae bacterium KSS8]|uniref:Type VI secretion system-associated protein TagF n=1 Tax=Endosaccharibacter trunci TaxID=2812733 RepID=A0ABT1W8R5_9PROT|nr:type VI secretion system-associated protein TagF [Acetobacteraceae bacterium KSS8]
MSTILGYYGKLPSRGDFLRYRLPDEAVRTLDGWIARNLVAQQRKHGPAFDLIWERAPIWRFHLGAGRLDHVAAASGIWMPSIDRAGRCFPMVLLGLHPAGTSLDPALDLLLPSLQATIQFDAPPDDLQAAIDAAGADPVRDHAPPDGWRRAALHDGSPVRLSGGLPEGDGFDLLLQLLPQEQAVIPSG